MTAIQRFVRRYRNLLLCIVIVIVTVEVIGLIVLWVAPKPSLSPAIQDKYPATVFLPGSGSKIARSTAKFQADQKLLTFTAAAFGVTMTYSEQPTPDQFVDVPAAYDKFTADIGQYDQFDSNSGTVHLARVANQNNQQVAIMNAKGTLLFVRPEGQLTTDQWKQIFKTLSVQ